MARMMYLLNSIGHVTVQWEEQNDALVLPVIEQMLAQKYRFFILGESGEQTEVTSTAQVSSSRSIVVADDALQQLADAGVLQIASITEDRTGAATGELAKTAAQVAAHDTVVTKPARGG